MATLDGFPVVLTADRTLTADYRLLFDGMLAASQTTTSPPALFGRLLMPHRRRSGVRAAVAPLGLRRIEAALLEGGFRSDEVAVVNEDRLGLAIGDNTRVIGISSGEPAGLGMNTSTMTAVAGGRVYPEAMFRRLTAKVRRLNRNGAKVVLGGPGAWQLAGNAPLRRTLGIDHVVSGYADGEMADIFRRLIRGEVLPEVIEGQWRPGTPIPPIRGASTMGVVEISRGCGLGCSFCTIARVPMVHLPPETILADVRTNVLAGQTHVAALSEDFFRYGGQGIEANPDALVALLRDMRRIPNLGLIQIDHATAASVAQYDDGQLRAIRDLLVGNESGRYVWVNMGVETASDTLLHHVGAAAKARLASPQPWGEFCAGQLQRLCCAGFFPMASLMIGLPGERDEDLRETLAWVNALQAERLAIFPVLYAPVDGATPLDPRRLRPLHWELIRACYRLNFRWVPWFYRDNQAAAGVSALKRAALQAMGYGQILQWRLLFAWHHWKARR